MKKLVLGIFLMLFTLSSWAQSTYGINGRVVDEKTQKPLQNVVASLANTNQSVTTNINGEFTISNLSLGKHRLVLTFTGYTTKALPFEVENEQNIDLGTITLDATNDSSVSRGVQKYKVPVDSS